MIHVANILIYGGVAGLVVCFVGPWWGAVFASVAAVVCGVQFAMGGKHGK